MTTFPFSIKKVTVRLTTDDDLTEEQAFYINDAIDKRLASVVKLLQNSLRNTWPSLEPKVEVTDY